MPVSTVVVTSSTTGCLPCCGGGCTSPCTLCGRGVCAAHVYLRTTGCVGEFFPDSGPDAWTTSGGASSQTYVKLYGFIDKIDVAVQCGKDVNTPGLSGVGSVTSATLPCAAGATAVSPPTVTLGAIVCDAGGFVSQTVTFDFGPAGTVVLTVVV